ncbi:hypothetical protein [Streptomyces prunicolor]|uniref:hypothetical protein n=1 Tax=Streptomyces prunicolor TaxID=67348 RepID=UPI0033F02029
MSDLQQIEYRAWPQTRSLSYDIARHIADYHLHGRIFVVADTSTFLSAVRKGWFRVKRKLDLERARTVDAEKVAALRRKLNIMDALVFTLNPSMADTPDAVFFTTSEELAKKPRQCLVLYLTHPVDDATYERLTSYMPVGGLVVRYNEPPPQQPLHRRAWRH